MQSDGGVDGRTVKLSREASFYVGLPENGQFETKVYPDSGRMTSEAIVNALLEQVRTVQMAKMVASLSENLQAARNASTSHMVHATISHWEERATEWSGIPDRISIRLQLIETSSGVVLDSTVISGKSRWATFGGDHPQELLPKPLAKYTESLF
jgi:hypothetical protein